MGAAGDMLTAALYELLPNREEFLHTLNHMGLPGVEFHAVPAQSCGISGTHMDVVVHGEREESLDHHHNNDNDHYHHHNPNSSYYHNGRILQNSPPSCTASCNNRGRDAVP